jgi:hypothetical protein
MTALSGDANNIGTVRDRPNKPLPPSFSDPFEHRAFLKFRLAQAYRIFGELIFYRNWKRPSSSCNAAKYGYDEGVAGHITVRVRVTLINACVIF